jgi:transcriptional regulator GlxA family with amidase domain
MKMNIAFILYDGFTLLDFVGVHDILYRLNQELDGNFMDKEICALSQSVKSGEGAEIVVDKVKPILSNYDMIVVPGGRNARELIEEEEFIDWIKTASKCPYKVSVCTGSLILGKAGFLNGRNATTHFLYYDYLEKFQANVIKERVVSDNNVITAGGVSCSLDLGIYLCEKFANKDIAKKIKEHIEFYEQIKYV